MAWARLVRGTRSKEKAVTCRSRRTAMASTLAAGGRKHSRVDSTGRARASSAVGGDTATTISAASRASDRRSTTRTPSSSA